MMGPKDILVQSSGSWPNEIKKAECNIYVHLMVIIVYILVPTFV